MAKKRESKDTGAFLTQLQRIGYFRKISDRVQIGIPDVIGSYRGRFFGFEFKSVTEIPKDGFAPAKGQHPFTPSQINNLKEIERRGSGMGFGVILCGKYAFFIHHKFINEEGRADISQALRIVRELGEWPLIEALNNLMS